MYKQIIIARKDLNMSPGKLAAQVSHGSMVFLTNMIKNHTKIIYDNCYFTTYYGYQSKRQEYLSRSLDAICQQAYNEGYDSFYANSNDTAHTYDIRNQVYEQAPPRYHYEATLNLDKGLFGQWICGSFTKCVLEAKNKENLLKAKTLAEKIGLKENTDFFLIRDNCLTELKPEDDDGRTLTVIGFKPMDDKIIDKIGRKYQLYR